MAFDRDGHPQVVRARAEAAQLDDRTRADRIANCLIHGHPYGETFDTGFGHFCPHCCGFFYPEPEPKAPAEAGDAEETEETADAAAIEAPKPAATPKTAPKKPTKGPKTSH